MRLCALRNSFTLAFDSSHSIPFASQDIRFTFRHHLSLSAAFASNSCHVRLGSTSMSKSPSRLLLCINSATFLINLCSLVRVSFFRRKMCPSHLSLRARIHCSMLKVVVLLDASSCLDFPVMCESMYAFAPLMHRDASSSKSHASDPYTRILQHAAMYKRTFKSSFKLEAHTCRNVPARCFAIAQRLRTSGI